jgi:trk system potassium uptake protein TrkH
MGLTRFVRPVRYQVLLANCCMLSRLFALILSVPLAISLLLGDFTISLILGALLVASYLIGHLERVFAAKETSRQEALIITALAYLMYSLASGLAFLPVTSFIDGFFESMSGFTTTGLSMLAPESLPRSLLFFRAYMQWIGGAGIVILSLIILVGPGRNAFRLYTSEFGEERLVGSIVDTALIVARVYAALTLLGYFAYLLAGMDSFEALVHILSTVSTGGFAAHADSAGHYHSAALRTCIVVFMLLGAIAFPSYYSLWRKGLKGFVRDRQLKALLVVAGCASLVFILAGRSGALDVWASIFDAVSALTTTGFHIGATSALPGALLALTVILMLLGGAAGSTAGGLKIFRVGVLLRMPFWLVMRVLLPEEAEVPIKYDGKVLSDAELKQVFGFSVAYLALIAASALIFTAYGFPAAASVFECTSALGTVGLSVGITSPGLPWLLKLVLLVNMWAGRLEILPLLVLFSFRIWVPQRSGR